MFNELPHPWGSFLVAYGEYGNNLIYILFKPYLTIVQ
jgi:hypothetical protein